MRIPVSRGRVDAQAQMQTFTPNTGLAEIGRSIGGALEARSEKLREEQDKTEKADFALQSSKIGADISVVDNDLLLKMQSGELRINLAKAQDSLSEACDKFNDHMARRDNRIRKLQDELDVTKKELACTTAAVKMSGKIYASHINLLDYLDKHCNISVRDEKGRFSGRVTANGLYDARFRQETYKGEI